MNKKDKINLWNRVKAHAENKLGVSSASITLEQYEQLIEWTDRDKVIEFTRDANIYNVVFKQEEMPE
jgi:hypothetical protein